MEFRASELQTAISETLTKFLRDKYDFQTRISRTSAPERDDALWREFAELGVLSVAFGEELGGLGGGFSELAAVMRIMGRHIVNEPFLSTVIMSGGVLQRCDNDLGREVLRKIGSGATTVSLAQSATARASNGWGLGAEAVWDGERYRLSGRKVLVLDGAQAGYYLVTAWLSGRENAPRRVGLFLVEHSAEGIEKTDYRSIDDGHMSDLSFDNVSLSQETLLLSGEAAEHCLLRVQDEAILAICAEACGIMEAMLEQTVEYTRQRKQFGRAIADNQVIQHRLVDMMIGTKQATSMTNVAARMLDAPDRQSVVAATKSFVSKTSRQVGQSAIQLHGGIGVTNDIAISHYFRRALMLEQQFGSADEQLDRYLELSQRAGVAAA